MGPHSSLADPANHLHPRVTLALYLLSALAALLAWAVARRHRDHRPVALLLTYGVASDLARRLLWTLLPPPRLGAPPLQGLARVFGHLEHALFLGWSFGVAALALWTLARRRPRLIAVLYVAAVAGLVVGYPAIRGDALRRYYLAVELAAALVGVACGVSWYRRGQPATITSLTSGFLVAGHLAYVVAGPYRFGLFGQAWVLANWIYLAVITTLILLHLGSLWTAEP